MLKITMHDAAGARVFEVAGRLAGRWVEELELFWRSAATRSGEPVRVDLSSVTFIDEKGKQLLKTMHRDGVKLVASGCLNNCIVERIVHPAKEA